MMLLLTFDLKLGATQMNSRLFILARAIRPAGLTPAAVEEAAKRQSRVRDSTLKEFRNTGILTKPDQNWQLGIWRDSGRSFDLRDMKSTRGEKKWFITFPSIEDDIIKLSEVTHIKIQTVFYARYFGCSRRYRDLGNAFESLDDSRVEMGGVSSSVRVSLKTSD